MSGDPAPIAWTGPGGAFLKSVPVIGDWRGKLAFTEYDEAFPFRPRRHFLVFGVPADQRRGEHAHRLCHQYLICVAGSCAAVVDDGTRREEVLLDRPELGLYMPPMIWGTQYRYSADAVLLVLASHHYDPDDYIRDYQDFLAAAGAHG
jgi:UDP-2-acetamido-3-amino-2,3-dideoxy-glucuronate N-acetyltransferase